MGPHPTVAEARRCVRHALSDLQPGDDVLLAVSGGADSLALAAAAAFEARSAVWRLRAMIVDHGLQEQSGDAARRAAEHLASMNVEARIAPVTVADDGNQEAAARTARYAALDSDSADAIMLAHTLDDQAETVLMGLGRGSGSRSLAGMRPVRGRYRRPFLSLRREDTETVCREHGLTWWQDPHNEQARFRRVRIRREVIPLLEDVLGGGAAEALARSADQFRADADYLDSLAAEHAELTVDALSPLPEALRLRVLRRAALEAGARPDELRYNHVCGIDSLITDWHGQLRIELPGHVSAVRQGDRIMFTSTPVAG